MITPDRVKTFFGALVGIAGSQKSLAKELRMSQITLSRRLQSPGDFTVNEITRACKYARKAGLTFQLESE